LLVMSLYAVDATRPARAQDETLGPADEPSSEPADVTPPADVNRPRARSTPAAPIADPRAGARRGAAGQARGRRAVCSARHQSRRHCGARQDGHLPAVLKRGGRRRDDDRRPPRLGAEGAVRRHGQAEDPRPDRMAAEVVTDRKNEQMFYDGTTFTVQ
jgi:hypothetical protein